uniref:Uncharacterized protein n=1 Tax=Lactuca sativa TaxID=4236 RepID=A0A9R1VIJ3_LACSA|nr:hypothetical protein LSAT_V11C500246070 [Lactuca sativa]
MSFFSSSSKTDNKKPFSKKLVPFPPRPNKFSPLSPENKSTVSPFNKTPSSSPLGTQKIVLSTKTPYIINPNIERIQIHEDSKISKLNKKNFIFSLIIFLVEGKPFILILIRPENIIKPFFKNLALYVSLIVPIHMNEQLITIKLKFSSKSHSEKILEGYPAYPKYSYYAWSKAFLVRNFSHSWFIFFYLNFDYKYPKWFVNWYKFMGLIPKCLPDEVLNGFLKFKELFVQPIPEFEYLLQIFMLFKIPRIMSWTYNYQESKDIYPPWLNYQYRIK